MNKLKPYLFKFKYEISLFAVLCTNFLLLFTKDVPMSDILYPLHLVDTKIGLISRTLVGSISGFLWKNPTKENILFLHISVCVLTFLLTAIFFAKCIKSAEEKSGKILFAICLVIAVFPYGFRSYINLFEILDIYWVLSAVLCLLVSDNKKTAFLIPIFIFTGLWVHFSFVLAFMPLIYILCFNKCVKEKSRINYILTSVMLVVSVSATFYFVLTNRTFNVMPFEEFIDYIIEKAGSEITDIERYIGQSFRPYNEMNRLYNLTDMSEDSFVLSKQVVGYFNMALRDTTVGGILCNMLLASPVVIFFEKIWHSAVKTAEDKKEKFIYFLCCISPIIQFIACFTSSDTSRWLSLMVISDLFLLALFVKERALPVTSALNLLAEKLKKHKHVLLFVLLFYLSMVFVW